MVAGGLRPQSLKANEVSGQQGRFIPGRVPRSLLNFPCAWRSTPAAPPIRARGAIGQHVPEFCFDAAKREFHYRLALAAQVVSQWIVFSHPLTMQLAQAGTRAFERATQDDKACGSNFSEEMGLSGV
jgi:hypothetical protein